MNPYKCQYCVCRYSKVTHLTQHLNLKHANQLKNARLVAVGGPSTASPVVAGGGPAAGSVVKPNPPPKLPYTFSEKRLLPGLEGYEQNVQVKIGPLDTVSFTKLVKNNVVGFHCKLCSYQNAYPDAVFIHSKVSPPIIIIESKMDGRKGKIKCLCVFCCRVHTCRTGSTGVLTAFVAMPSRHSSTLTWNGPTPISPPRRGWAGLWGW